MNDTHQNQLVPTLVERAVGDWLAITPAGAAPRIGVRGASKEQAIQRFRESWSEWLAILRDKGKE